jgi:hypothetical protein
MHFLSLDDERKLMMAVCSCQTVTCRRLWYSCLGSNSILSNSIQFISQSTDPLRGHKEHMDMEIVKLYNLYIYIYRVILLILKREKTVSHRINILL